MEAAEEEFGVKGAAPARSALESPYGILNAYEICAASDRMFGVAISGGDFRKCMQTVPSPTAWICWPPGTDAAGRLCRRDPVL